jgi:hypothetical protein
VTVGYEGRGWAPAMPLSRCDLARNITRDAGHISDPPESAIVMIWHIDVGFPTQGSSHVRVHSAAALDPSHADTG